MNEDENFITSLFKEIFWIKNMKKYIFNPFCQWRRTLSDTEMVKDTLIEVELPPYPISYTDYFYKLAYIVRTNPYNYFICVRGDIVNLYCGSAGNSTAGNIIEFAIGI